MKEPPTCGKGLAEHATLPAKMADITASVAEILEVHMTALDLTDETSRREHDVYRELAQQHREIATRLQATAKRMAGYRDLPMGRHDMKAMAAPEVRETFEDFVNLEEELLALLEKRVEQDRKMLSGMAAPAANRHRGAANTGA